MIISVDKVKEQAIEYGHSEKREFAFLITQSMLHLFGYDHMEADEAAVMEEHQRKILDALGITRDVYKRQVPTYGLAMHRLLSRKAQLPFQPVSVPEMIL